MGVFENYESFGVLFGIFLIGSAVRHVIDWLKLPVPYTVLLFFVGIILGYFSSIDLYMGPHQILFIFLPTLIFEGAFAIDIYVFKQIFLQILILAVPALVTVTVITGVLSLYVLQSYEWDLSWSILFGAMLSATDPVAVVAIMKELGAAKQLSLLIEGESLLNDGTAIVLYELIKDYIKKGDNFVVINEIGPMIWKAVRMSIGGPLFGFGMAYISVMWLKKTFNDPLTEIVITFSMTYLTFYVADHMLKISGVLAVVVLGAYLSAHRTSISPEVEHLMHCFWETMGFLANTLIFALCGIIISQEVLLKSTPKDYMLFLILYCMLNIARGLTFTLFSPIMGRLGYGITWQAALVSTWSGLRGGVSVVLALLLYHEEEFKKEKNPALAEFVNKAMFHTSMLVSATLVINATTVGSLLTFLGLTSITDSRRQAMKKAVSLLEETKDHSCKVWKIDRFLADADWKLVNRICTIEDPFKDTEVEKVERDTQVCLQCGSLVPYEFDNTELKEMSIEATQKYLKLLKHNAWHQFEHGLISSFSVRKLSDLIDEALDSKSLSMIDTNEIRKLWQNPNKHLNLVRRILLYSVVKQDEGIEADDRPTKVQGRCVMRKLRENRWIMAIIHGFDAVQIVTLFLIHIITNINLLHVYVALHILNIIMVVSCTLYSIFRVVGSHNRYYLDSWWFYINGVVLILGIIDCVLSSLKDKIFYGETWNLTDVTTVFVVLRILRLLNLLEVVIVFMVVSVSRNNWTRLNQGCDLARTFVRATEHTMKYIDDLSEHPDVCNTVRRNAEAAKIKILRQLGFLQGLHPDVVMAHKTHQAIRTNLNEMRTGISQFIDDGGIDEPEGLLFNRVIETKMKQLQNNPIKMNKPSVKAILAALPWIANEQSLVEFIYVVAERRMFHFGDIIMRIGDAPDGVYFIISGLVKVEIPVGSETDLGIQEMKILDFLSTGNVIGEISALTMKPRSAMVTCESSVKALYMDLKDMAMLFEAFSDMQPPLLDRLWRICALRISINILMSVPIYHGIDKDKLTAQLASGSVETLEEGKDYIEISSKVMDCVLIIGRLYDQETQEKYQGQCYIPRGPKTLVKDPGSENTPVFFLVYKSKRKRTMHEAEKNLMMIDF